MSDFFHHAINVKTEAEAFRIINPCVVWKTDPSVAPGQTLPLFDDNWYGPKVKPWVRGQVEDGLQGDICPQGQVRVGLRENCYIWQLGRLSSECLFLFCVLPVQPLFSFVLETEYLSPLNLYGSDGPTPLYDTMVGCVTQT